MSDSLPVVPTTFGAFRQERLPDDVLKMQEEASRKDYLPQAKVLQAGSKPIKARRPDAVIGHIDWQDKAFETLKIIPLMSRTAAYEFSSDKTGISRWSYIADSDLFKEIASYKKSPRHAFGVEILFWCLSGDTPSFGRIMLKGGNMTDDLDSFMTARGYVAEIWTKQIFWKGEDWYNAKCRFFRDAQDRVISGDDIPDVLLPSQDALSAATALFKERTESSDSTAPAPMQSATDMPPPPAAVPS